MTNEEHDRMIGVTNTALFYVRYLLVPTTLAASAGALVLLARVLSGPLGDHALTMSLAGALAVAGTWIGVWEHRCPAERVRARRSPRQRRGDLRYMALMAASLLAWTRALTWLGAQRGALLFGGSAGSWPLALQVGFAFISSELLAFLVHWASHRSGSRWLWRMHAIHHRPEGLSLLSAVRVHPFDLAYQILALAPAALLGVTPEALVGCLASQLVVGAFQHADLDLRLGPFNWILPGPEVHRIHHHIDPAEGESFAFNMPVLDLLFRTAGARHGPGAVPMGVAGERD